MIEKIVTVLACLACTRADVFSPHSLVPTVDVYPLINNGPNTRRAYPVTPAPVYEDNTDESKPTYGSQMPLFNVINTPLANARRSDYRIVDIGRHAAPYSFQAKHNKVLFQPAYNPPAASTRSLSAPVTYTTLSHSTPLANAYSGPVVATSYGRQAFSSYTPVASRAVQTTITYSEDPLSQVTFTSHGSRFTW